MTSTILFGRAVDVDAVTAAILAATDGATVDGRGMPYSGDGIIVAVPEHAAVLPIGWDAATMGDTIAEWVARVAPSVAARADYWFGAWWADGVLYVDVAQSYSSADRDLAVAAGRARDQIAVWDAGRRQEILTGGSGLPAGAITVPV